MRYNDLGMIKKKLFKSINIPSEIQGLHDCGLRALHIVLPNLSIKGMKEAFSGCCQQWPYKGISNKEFNITLACLKIKDKFDYVAPEKSNLSDIMSYKKDVFIVLIYGHYIVIKNGICVEDIYNYKSNKTKVYCYWRLRRSLFFQRFYNWYKIFIRS